MRIEGVSAVVTGGASGLGEATARALAAAGARVAVFDRDAAAGDAVARSIGGVFCAVDVTSDEAVADGFARAAESQGPARILVCCAGVAPAERTVVRDRATGVSRPHAMALFQRVLDINLAGTFRCVAHAALGMAGLDPLDEERGVIVTTASVAAEDGQIGQAAYAASKAGVAGMTLPIARDLAPSAIRIVSILPGIFGTPMVRGMPDPVQEALAAAIPFPRRLGQPEEYAELVLAIVRNGYWNGATVRLDGAVRMGPK